MLCALTEERHMAAHIGAQLDVKNTHWQKGSCCRLALYGFTPAAQTHSD